MIGKSDSASNFYSPSTREKHNIFEGVIHSNQKNSIESYGPFLFKNLSRAWDLIFTTNVYT